MVIETSALSAIELSQHCREKGLYPEQVKAWRQACLDGQATAVQRSQNEGAQTRADRKRIRELERELQRKEKALAEAAAIIILKKKVQSIWGGEDEPTDKKSGR